MTLTDKQKDIIKTLNLGYERGHLRALCQWKSYVSN